jgi:L-threonate 2-dehydrogenase
MPPPYRTAEDAHGDATNRGDRAWLDGAGMAQSLKRAGFAVTGCDVNEASVARFVAEGGQGAATPSEAARDAAIVVSVVVNAAQTEQIPFGRNGVAETLAKGGVFVSSATMDP